MLFRSSYQSTSTRLQGRALLVRTGASHSNLLLLLSTSNQCSSNTSSLDGRVYISSSDSEGGRGGSMFISSSGRLELIDWGGDDGADTSGVDLSACGDNGAEGSLGSL